MKRSLCIVIAFSALLSGCSQFKNFIASSEERQTALRPQVDALHRYADRGIMEEALLRVSPDSKPSFIEKMESEKNKERVLEKTIESVDFNADVNEATVTVAVRYFKKPNLVVMQRQEEEVWRYSDADGWLWKKSERIGTASSDKPATLNGTL